MWFGWALTSAKDYWLYMLPVSTGNSFNMGEESSFSLWWTWTGGLWQPCALSRDIKQSSALECCGNHGKYSFVSGCLCDRWTVSTQRSISIIFQSDSSDMAAICISGRAIYRVKAGLKKKKRAAVCIFLICCQAYSRGSGCFGLFFEFFEKLTWF